MKPDGDPVDLIAAMGDFWLRLEDMGEKTPDYTYANVMLRCAAKFLPERIRVHKANAS